MAGIIKNHPRKLVAGGVLIAGECNPPQRAALCLRQFQLPGDLILNCVPLAAFTGREYLPNPFRTPGVSNIETRWSSGGGAQNHTPGTATKRGSHDAVVGNVETSKGMGTPHWEEHIGGQKPEVGHGLSISASGTAGYYD